MPQTFSKKVLPRLQGHIICDQSKKLATRWWKAEVQTIHSPETSVNLHGTSQHGSKIITRLIVTTVRTVGMT